RQQRAGPRLLQGARCDRRRRPPVRPVELEAVERLWRQAECCGGITLCALRVGARLSLLLLRLEQRVLHGDQGCGRVLAGSHAGTLLLQELLLLPDQPVEECAAPECALPVRQRGDERTAYSPGGSQQLPALAADRNLRLRYHQPPQGRRAQRQLKGDPIEPRRVVQRVFGLQSDGRIGLFAGRDLVRQGAADISPRNGESRIVGQGDRQQVGTGPVRWRPLRRRLWQQLRDRLPQRRPVARLAAVPCCLPSGRCSRTAESPPLPRIIKPGLLPSGKNPDSSLVCQVWNTCAVGSGRRGYPSGGGREGAPGRFTERLGGRPQMQMARVGPELPPTCWKRACAS